MTTRQEREREQERDRERAAARVVAAAQKVAATPEEKVAEPRPTVKCGTCQRSCSEAGHLKGKEVTPSDAKGYKLYECARCGLYLEQPACECCGVEVGTLRPSEDDTAQEAAKRMAKKA